jgi:hypothetical protein
VHRYQGAPWGSQLSDLQLHQFFLDKISPRLCSWTSKMLSFTGRLLLIKHVLQAIPIYHMMFMKTPTKTVKQLEQIFKDFIWGFKKDGGWKTPLVSWHKLVRRKACGGLGFKNIAAHSEALLSRWVTTALDEPHSDWALLFKANLQLATWKNGKHLRQ